MTLPVILKRFSRVFDVKQVYHFPRFILVRQIQRFGIGTLCLGIPTLVHASEVQIISRTFGEGYVVQAPDPNGTQLLKRRRFVQYLNLGAYNLLPPKQADELERDPNDGQLRIVTSMRLRHDFGDYLDAPNQASANLVNSIDGQQVDLLFAYLEGERLGGWVDFRAGRQFETAGLDWYAFDGAWLRSRTPAHLALEVFGGFQVLGNDALGSPNFQLDGISIEDAARTVMIGTGLSIDRIRWLDGRLAWRRTWSPHSLNSTNGLSEYVDDPTQIPKGAVHQDIISLNLAGRAVKGHLNPFLALRYNLGTARLDDVTGGIQARLTQIHTLQLFYLRTRPVFDLDSIFNVFASEPLDDLRLSYEVRVSPRWRVSGRGQLRFFGAKQTEYFATDPADPLALGYGGGATAAFQISRFALRIDGYGIDGEGGLRAGGSIDTRTMVAWDRIALDGRVYGIYYRDEQVERRRGYSVAIQAGMNVQLWQGIHLNLLAEEMVTTYYSHAFRLLAILSADWSLRLRR